MCNGRVAYASFAAHYTTRGGNTGDPTPVAKPTVTVIATVPCHRYTFNRPFNPRKHTLLKQHSARVLLQSLRAVGVPTSCINNRGATPGLLGATETVQ